MRKSDHSRFVDVLNGVLDVYGKERTDTGVALWWKLLEPYDLKQIESAFAEHARDCRFAPTPADLIGILRQRDGRPTADEAWAMIPRGESESVCWNDEMSAAYGIAAPLLEAKDQVAARRAFIDKYEREVALARSVGKPNRSWFSWGRDAVGRQAAIDKAVALGMITSERGASFLLTVAPQTVPDLPGLSTAVRRIEGVAQ